MRVALLYSGLPRMWEESVPTHRPLFPGAEVHAFCHFWDTVPPEERQRLNALLRPALCQYESVPDFSMIDQYEWLKRDNINVPSRMVSQYAGWQRVGTLFAPYAPLFDVVVRIRTDLSFFRPLNVDLDAIARKQTDFVGYEWTETKGVLFDAFALGTPSVMVHFHMLLSRLWDYAADTAFNAEFLLTRHVRTYHRPVSIEVRDTLPFFIRRPHMAGWSVEQCVAEGPGVAKWRDPEIHNAHLAYHGKRAGDAGIQHVNRFRARQLGLPEA
ncbi:MAG TPA: hypothetical protein VHB27_14525 [Rhodopila sp.]|uniref:hypothetical protein n=1 Tax=Rhodopila sp. TaxID=2480087 RepID=UPI002BD4E092|nr:hypothetical protein [Rhodopila sp.]HVY16438.1 hypothetical protein [Rhodopila sp.]